MAKSLQDMARLVKLQDKIAQQKMFEQMLQQAELHRLRQLSDAVTETLEQGGIAWSLFPAMSNRYLSNVEAEKRATAQAIQRSAESAMREKMRFESLAKRHALLARDDARKQDDDMRLETLARHQFPARFGR